MDIGHAIGYIFEDKRWIQKLAPLLLVGILSLVPIFGLLATALGLGFMLQLVCNVRDGLPRPLPEWKDFEEKFRVGGYVLLAGIVYNLPLILFSACTFSIASLGGIGFLGFASGIYIACCAVPIMLVYALFGYTMLGVGVTEYLQTNDVMRMYRPLHLWDVMQANSGTITQWMMYALLTNIVLAILLVIPVLGWIVVLLFGYPVQGHLFGQFAHKLGISNRPQAKRRTSNAR